MNRKNSESNFVKKIRTSLALKLNAIMFFKLLSIILSINLLILLIGIFSIFWKAEEGMTTIVEMRKISSFPQSSFHIGKYTLSEDIEPSGGFLLPKIMEKYLPGGSDWERNLEVLNTNENFMKKLESIRYAVTIKTGDKEYQITYSLGVDLKILLSLFAILITIEFLLLLGEISSGSRSIRRALKPIYDLSQTAKSLNKDVSHNGSKLEGKEIKDLTGIISNIDADKLNKPIYIDTSQEELKELATAINGMLNRINSAYQSQVRFVSDASHELRTPISVIQGYVNLLDRWGKRDEKTLQESIDAIKSEVQNMKELVEQLLFLARGDNDTIQLRKEDFDICQVVEEIAREAQMIDQNHIYEVDIEGEVYINADKQLMKQAIRILVDNSIKYTPDGEKIMLKVKKENDKAYITVQDNGIGIDPKDLPHIFDRFYRSDESRARKTGGSGLGLSIAKWIIERHGGYFEVLSRVNIGTRITIVITGKIL